MDGAEIKRQREELEAFFEDLYKKDKVFIIQKAKEYAGENKELAKAYLEGYKESILNPHTRSIRRIVMYTLDYIPYYKKVPTIRNISDKIRNIFREKRYPDENVDNS